MIRTDSSSTRLVRLPAIALALALSGLLLAGLFALVGPRAAAAAGLAEPAVAYPCSEAGLNSALAAGGSATFNCGGPTVVIVAARKTVLHNGTLDGGSKLILSGGGITGVFTVAAGVHLNLLNLTLRDGSAPDGGGIFNRGVLNASHVNFFSNFASRGGALYNAPGAAATVTNASVISNTADAGALYNGDADSSGSAALVVASSTFSLNQAASGGAILNDYGRVTVTGSSFSNNLSILGGAIYNNSALWVDGSTFTGNMAESFVLARQPAAPALSQSLGGAIYLAPDADAAIHTSSFTNNFGAQGGGAIGYGFLPATKIISDAHRLTIDGSSFTANCTGGEGGAVAASLHTTVNDSIFQLNRADAHNGPCFAGQASLASGPSSAAPALPPSDPNRGSGGAIYSSLVLEVSTSTFLSNTATITQAAGGGAVYNYIGGSLIVGGSAFSGNTSATHGGAIMNDPGALAHVVGSNFVHNQAIGGWGGAIGNFGALTIDDSTFTANSEAESGEKGGGALYSAAGFALSAPNGSGPHQPRLAPQTPQGFGVANFLTVNHSTFTANTSDYEGGAIDAGPALISNSTFMSNTAQYGGAIDVLDTFTLTGNTFYANMAITTTNGAARQGGAIDTNGEPTLIVNNTFYRNRAQGSAEGGAVHVDTFNLGAGPEAPGGEISSATIKYSTFLSNTADTPGNGGAIWQNQAGLAAATNVLLGYNTGGDCNFQVVYSGANLEFGDGSCGSASVQTNPLALPPANNGGPTLTSALLPGSPAINAGDNLGCPATDQRGAHRPVGVKCDIGAFEFGGILARLWLPVVRK